MPPVFQPRTPTQAPVDIEALLASMSEEELIQLIGGEQAIAQDQMQTAETDMAGIEDLLAQEAEAAAQQTEFENLMEMLQLLEEEQVQPSLIRDPGPQVPQGETFYDKDDPIGSFAMTAIANQNARANSQWAMDNTPAARWETPPGMGAGEPLEAKVARARTLLDLLNNKGATGVGAEGSASPAGGMSYQGAPMQGPPTPEAIPPDLQQIATQTWNRQGRGGLPGGSVLELLKRLSVPNSPAVRFPRPF